MGRIEKQIADAERLYTMAHKERTDLEGNLAFAANGFQACCDRLFKVVADLRREIARLEREAAPLVKPQPPGKKAGCFDI